MQHSDSKTVVVVEGDGKAEERGGDRGHIEVGESRDPEKGPEQDQAPQHAHPDNRPNAVFEYAFGFNDRD